MAVSGSYYKYSINKQKKIFRPIISVFAADSNIGLSSFRSANTVVIVSYIIFFHIILIVNVNNVNMVTRHLHFQFIHIFNIPT